MQNRRVWWIWIKLQIGVHCVKLTITEHNEKYEQTHVPILITKTKEISLDFVFKF